VGDRRAARRDQRDRVGLAFDPRLLQPHGGRLQAADGSVGAGERHERIVDLRLRDGHRIGAVVAHPQLDHAGAQHRLLDRELLDRRAAAISEAGPAEDGERRDRGGDQRQRDDREQPGRQPAGAQRAYVPSGAVGLHHACTSKNPCQPSSVNSD
jgi:hypothetical protein